VFYQHVLSATFDHQQQRQYCSVFTTELFAYYLNIKLTSVAKCPVITGIFQRYLKCICEKRQIFVGDILVLKLLSSSLEQNICSELDVGKCDGFVICVSELDTSELVELLQKSAVEHFTTCHQLEAQQFGSVGTIVTTDYEALYAYILGDYRRCLQLSTPNVHTLLYAVYMSCVVTREVFMQLLTAVMLIVNPDYRELRCENVAVLQLTLSLYLMTQCQLKLRYSVTSMAQTLNYINQFRRRISRDRTFDHLTLRLASRKIVTNLKLMLNNF